MEESIFWADNLNAIKIIVHSGIDGFIQNVIENIKTINDDRIIVENIFYRECQGFETKKGVISSFEDIEHLIGNNINFCLDISHMIINCKFNNKKYTTEFDNLLKLDPFMFYVSYFRWDY
jgi:hypothetical protein